MWRSYCCLLLTVLHFSVVGGVIWSRPSDRHQASPLEINAEEDAVFGQAAADHSDSQERRLLKRQSAGPSNIGYTAHLPDNHPHGLVHWTGFPSDVLFVLTRSTVRGVSTESWLWRSTDYGHNFTNNTVFWNEDTIINWYYIAPLSEYLIFADIAHQMLWVTSDEGESYTNHSLPFTPNRITFQSRLAPGSDSVMLAQYVLGYDETLSQLWVSTNLGNTWRKLGDNITRYSWRILSSALEDNTTVYYEKTFNSTHSQLWTSTFPYTASNLFQDLPPFLSNTFILSNEYMFVQMSASATPTTQYSSPLWVSRNRHAFRQARFPLQSQERHYAVVDTSEGQVFIGVYHDINNTNLYLSEVEGVSYTLSLTNLISPPESQWIEGYPKFDLHVVEGLVGTFIANRKDSTGRFGSTVISYDKGGNWVQLRPPTLDRQGNFIDCQQPNCSLHLHIQASRDTGFQSILTQDSAIGLIMAAGNLGSRLVTDNAQLRQYFSRDGGFTWLEVDSGYRQFQFAALGAIVASVGVFQYTSSVKWSCNEGANWTTVNFLDIGTATVQVIGMLTEPGERALHVTVFGIRRPFTEWLVIDLDFSSILPNQCTPADFFTWVPTDDRPGSRCLLGESITYERRRSEVCCYVNPDYNRLVSRSVCTCTREDFECDFGFERIFLNSPCTPLPDFSWPPLQPSDCQEHGTYTISSGYRKVAGDKCISGQEQSYFPIERPCILGAPKIISLQAHPNLVTPRLPVTFMIIQIEGGKLDTVYRWDYNDTTFLVVTGYLAAQQQVHSFTAPGVYNVTVLASNHEGSSFFSLFVTVVDPVSTVHIQPPEFITPRRELPVSRELVFRSEVSTMYHTNSTGDTQYLWNFGDGTPSASTPTVTHVFNSPGPYAVSLTVINADTNVVTGTLGVNILDLLTGVEIRLPSEPIAGETVSVGATYTTQNSTVITGITYFWMFGESSALNSSSEPLIEYVFPLPGNYTVELVATSSFSRSVAFAELIVLDKISAVVIIPPAQIIDNQLPTNLQVVFRAQVATKYNSSLTGDLSYSWEFGDGAPPTSGETGVHTFSSNGSYTVRCTVQQASRFTQQTVLLVTVFEASDSNSVEIRSSDLIGGEFVMTQKALILRVESIEGTGHIIPPDTQFKWTVLPLSASSCHSQLVQEMTSLNLTLMCWGVYEVTVVGKYSGDSLKFVKQLRITAEALVTGVVLSGVPAVMRSGAVAYLTFHPESHGAPYLGPIALSLMDSNSSQLAGPLRDPDTPGTNSLMVLLSRDEATLPNKTLTIMASNDVSSVTNSTVVTLAVHGEYGELRFLFPTSRLPSSFNSSSFQEELQTQLRSMLRTRYLSKFSESFVEIEGSGLRLNSSNDTSSDGSPPRLVARSSAELLLYIDINILPESLQTSSIQAIRNVSLKIQQDASTGKLDLTVQGSTISVEAVQLRNSDSVVVIDEPFNKNLYIELGVGLGAGMILILAVAIMLCAVVYFYRRKYKQLNVRYSRLRQTPVRFTFTQGGEMVEEEDFEQHSGDEEEEEEEMDGYGARMRSM